MFFESAEPHLRRTGARRLLSSVSGGEYEIEGITLEGDELESEVELTHVMPAPPESLLTGESMTSMMSTVTKTTVP